MVFNCTTSGELTQCWCFLKSCINLIWRIFHFWIHSSKLHLSQMLRGWMIFPSASQACPETVELMMFAFTFWWDMDGTIPWKTSWPWPLFGWWRWSEVQCKECYILFDRLVYITCFWKMIYDIWFKYLSLDFRTFGRCIWNIHLPPLEMFPISPRFTSMFPPCVELLERRYLIAFSCQESGKCSEFEGFWRWEWWCHWIVLNLWYNLCR